MLCRACRSTSIQRFVLGLRYAGRLHAAKGDIGRRRDQRVGPVIHELLSAAYGGSSLDIVASARECWMSRAIGRATKLSSTGRRFLPLGRWVRRRSDCKLLLHRPFTAATRVRIPLGQHAPHGSLGGRQVCLLRPPYRHHRLSGGRLTTPPVRHMARPGPNGGDPSG